MLRFRTHTGGELHVRPDEVRAVKSLRRRPFADPAELTEGRAELLVGGRWIAVDAPLTHVCEAIAEATHGQKQRKCGCPTRAAA